MQCLKYAIEEADLIVFDLDGTIIYLDVEWTSLKEELFSFFKRVWNQCSI
ncbi:MAG: hypothetical protein R2741_06340 [Methanolobus sp.]